MYVNGDHGSFSCDMIGFTSHTIVFTKTVNKQENKYIKIKDFQPEQGP